MTTEATTNVETVERPEGEAERDPKLRRRRPRPRGEMRVAAKLVRGNVHVISGYTDCKVEIKRGGPAVPLVDEEFLKLRDERVEFSHKDVGEGVMVTTAHRRFEFYDYSKGKVGKPLALPPIPERRRPLTEAELTGG